MRAIIRDAADLGRAIAEARRSSGFTQQQLADELGFDRTYLARMEVGESVRMFDRSMAVLRKLGAKVEIEFADG